MTISCKCESKCELTCEAYAEYRELLDWYNYPNSCLHVINQMLYTDEDRVIEIVLDYPIAYGDLRESIWNFKRINKLAHYLCQHDYVDYPMYHNMQELCEVIIPAHEEAIRQTGV